MKTFNSVSLFVSLLVSIFALTFCTNITDKKPGQPKAKKVKKELTAHGHTRVDNYYWLNDREDLEVISYLDEENAYTETVLKHTEEFQESLFDEIVGRIKQTDESVPYKRNGYFYYTRYEEGKE